MFNSRHLANTTSSPVNIHTLGSILPPVVINTYKTWRVSPSSLQSAYSTASNDVGFPFISNTAWSFSLNHLFLSGFPPKKSMSVSICGPPLISRLPSTWLCSRERSDVTVILFGSFMTHFMPRSFILVANSRIASPNPKLSKTSCGMGTPTPFTYLSSSFVRPAGSMNEPGVRRPESPLKFFRGLFPES